MKRIAVLMCAVLLAGACSKKTTEPDVDTQPPFIGWITPVPAPLNDTILTTDTLTVEFNVGDDGGVITSVDVYVAGLPVQSLTAAPYRTLLDLSVISNNRSSRIFATASDPAGNIGSTADTLKLVRAVAPDTAIWTLLPVAASPGPRENHSMSLDLDNRRALMFGGLSFAVFDNVNDLWAYDLDADMWDSLMPTGNVPSARTRHAADIVGNELILFGGFAMAAPDSVLEDYALLDLATLNWNSNLFSIGLRPAMGMATTASASTAYFFGGVGAEVMPARDSLWSYAPGGGWMLVNAIPSLPGNRVYAACAYDYEGNRLFLYGGSGVDEDLPTDNSNFRLDLSTNTWISTRPAGPPPVQKAEVVYDSLNNRMLMWGGSDDTGTPSTDVWEFSLGGHFWQLVPTMGTTPPGRTGHRIVIDAANSRFVMFGGKLSASGFATNETWELRW